MNRGWAGEHLLTGDCPIPGESQGWVGRRHWSAGVGDEAMVITIDGGGHGGRRHGLETGAFTLSSECQRSSQWSTSVLVISKSESHNADDDDDDGDEGYDSTNNSNDHRVHVGEN